MINKNKKLILSVVIIILLLLIVSNVSKILFKSENEVRVAKKFISRLHDKNIISKDDNMKEIIENIVNKTNNNMKVKYSIILDNYAVDISSDYKVIGFFNKNIENVSGNGEEISEGEAIYLAKQYLEEITNDDFGFKKVNVTEDEDSVVYNIIFYKYIGNYPCYNQEINTIINKFTGKLEGYTNYTIEDTDNVKYISSININKIKAKEILEEYFNEMNSDISVSDNVSLEYISISNSEVGLAYIFNITHINNIHQSNYQVFIRADTGDVLNNNVDVVLS